jgi:pimeloyl-ACP methyl ester carboxylesterase
MTGMVEHCGFVPCAAGEVHAVVTAPDGVPAGRALMVGPAELGPSSGRNASLAGVCRRLAERGLMVARYDHAGCGESGGQRGGFSRTDLPVEEAVAVLDTLAGPERREVGLVGLCLGALVALEILDRCPPARRALLVSPPVPDGPAVDTLVAKLQALGRAGLDVEVILGEDDPDLELGDGDMERIEQVAPLRTVPLRLSGLPSLAAQNTFDGAAQRWATRAFLPGGGWAA